MAGPFWWGVGLGLPMRAVSRRPPSVETVVHVVGHRPLGGIAVVQKPVAPWASFAASSRSITVIVVLSATPKAAPLVPTLNVAVADAVAADEEAVLEPHTGAVQRRVGDVDGQGGGQHLGVELLILDDEPLWKNAATSALFLPARLLLPADAPNMCGKVAASQSPSWVPGAAVEGLDQRLAVLVVPEADPGRLAVLDGPARPAARRSCSSCHRGPPRGSGRTGRAETMSRPISRSRCQPS